MQEFTMRPMGVGGIIDRSFKIYRDHFGIMITLSLLINGTANLIVSLLSLNSRVLDAESVVDSILNGRSPLGGLAVGGGNSALVSMLQWAVAVFVLPMVTGGITLIAMKAAHGEWDGNQETKDEIMMLYGKLIGTGFCISLISIGISLVALVFISVVGVLFESLTLFTLMVIALIFCLLPLMALAYPVAVGEQRFFFSWFGRAWKLLFSKFWKSLGLMLLTYLIVSVLSFAIGLVPQLLPPVVSVTADVVITGLLQPISIIAATLLYLDIRITTEGYDLELRAGEMRANQNPYGNSYGPRPGQYGGPPHSHAPYGGQGGHAPYQPPYPPTGQPGPYAGYGSRPPGAPHNGAPGAPYNPNQPTQAPGQPGGPQDAGTPYPNQTPGGVSYGQPPAGAPYGRHPAEGQGQGPTPPAPDSGVQFGEPIWEEPGVSYEPPRPPLSQSGEQPNPPADGAPDDTQHP